MTVDEAIKYVGEMVEIGETYELDIVVEENRQLVEWLKDYKRLLEQQSILDNIRAEIENLTNGDTPERIWNVDVLEIIDKYKAESEE